jgi:hypothetical protein
MPGTACGNTMLSHDLPRRRAEADGGLAQRPRDRAQRLARRHDDHRQDQQRQRRRAGDQAAPQAHDPHEDLEAEQAVDDARHAGEVGDVDLDELRCTRSLAAELLEVDGRAHPDGHRQRDGQEDQVQAAHDARQDAGLGRRAATESPSGSPCVRRGQASITRSPSSQPSMSSGSEQAGQHSRRNRRSLRRRARVCGCMVGQPSRRYLRASRCAKTFITKVITNRAAPTAKMVRNSSVPVGHVAHADLHDVGGHGLHRHARVEREARLLTRGDGHDHRLADGARDRRASIAAAMPERAAGSTTPKMPSKSGEAPRPQAASRSARGTA